MLPAKAEGKAGIMLDVGCGANPQQGFVTLDKRPLPHVDIVHDLEVFPYPLEDESCITIIAAHIIEHIKPWFIFQMFDEFWRVMKFGGQLCVVTPYAGSPGYWQDPTHCTGFNEGSFQYFDPEFHLYGVYRPKPWRIEKGFPIWRLTGNLEVLMRKIEEEP